MPSPYNLALVEHCSECSERLTNGGFCNMAAEPVEALDSMKFTGAYPKGALLFVEGEQPRGVEPEGGAHAAHGRAQPLARRRPAAGRSGAIRRERRRHRVQTPVRVRGR